MKVYRAQYLHHRQRHVVETKHYKLYSYELQQRMKGVSNLFIFCQVMIHFIH